MYIKELFYLQVCKNHLESHCDPQIVHSLSKQMDLLVNSRSFTYVKGRVGRSSEIIYVGNSERLDGHRAHAEKQLSDRHDQPHVVGVGQLLVLAFTTGLQVARVPLQVANIVTAWVTAGGHTHAHTQKTQKGGAGKKDSDS